VPLPWRSRKAEEFRPTNRKLRSTTLNHNLFNDGAGFLTKPDARDIRIIGIVELIVEDRKAQIGSVRQDTDGHFIPSYIVVSDRLLVAFLQAQLLISLAHVLVAGVVWPVLVVEQQISVVQIGLMCPRNVRMEVKISKPAPVWYETT
jgi:hypothetical protein